MGVIEFNPSLKDLIKFAGKAITDDNYLMCVQNLYEALSLANEGEEKMAVYKCFADMYVNCGNPILARNMLFRGCLCCAKKGYYRLDYDKFFPTEEPIIEIEEEIPLADSETVLGYNDACNNLLVGNYEQGLDILCDLPPDIAGLDAAMEILIKAINAGEKIDLTKHTYRMILLSGIYAAKSPDFVRLLLQGSEQTRTVMVAGAEFVAKDVEDTRILFGIAKAYFDEQEYDCARMCFEGCYKDNEVNLTLLFYLSACNYILGDKEKGDKFWYQFKACSQEFKPPYYIYERMFGEHVVPDFPYVSEFWIKDDLRYFEDGIFIERQEFLEKLNGVLHVVTDADRCISVIKNVDYENDLDALEVIHSCLISPLVSDRVKSVIIIALIETGYEGKLAVSFEKAGVYTSIVRLKLRGSNIWKEIYNSILSATIVDADFLPLNPSYLANSVKKFAKMCKNADIEPADEDIRFLREILSSNYLIKLTKGTNIKPRKLFPVISGDELRRGLKKFPPEIIHLEE